MQRKSYAQLADEFNTLMDLTDRQERWIGALAGRTLVTNGSKRAGFEARCYERGRCVSKGKGPSIPLAIAQAIQFFQ